MEGLWDIAFLCGALLDLNGLVAFSTDGHCLVALYFCRQYISRYISTFRVLFCNNLHLSFYFLCLCALLCWFLHFLDKFLLVFYIFLIGQWSKVCTSQKFLSGDVNECKSKFTVSLISRLCELNE